MAKLYIDAYSSELNVKKIAAAVVKTLGQKARLKAELISMQAEEMQKLNRESRGVDKVTDVLSFPSLDGIRGKVLCAKDYPELIDEKRLFIGSIVLCEEKIKEQAIEYGHSEEREAVYLIVHGLMHLFGYDHETEEDKKQMREKEKKALAYLGIKE